MEIAGNRIMRHLHGISLFLALMATPFASTGQTNRPQKGTAIGAIFTPAPVGKMMGQVSMEKGEAVLVRAICAVGE